MEWNNETFLDLDPQWINADPQFIQNVLSSPEEEIQTSSDNSPPSYFRPPSPSSSRIILLHKPRGSKGVWQEVEEGMKLRVSKPNGKKLKLQYFPEFEYDKNSPRLELLESQDDTAMNTFVVSKAKFEIELVKTLERSVDIEVKIFQPSKRLMFRLTVVTQNGAQTFVAKSIEFSTQSSGGHLRETTSVESLAQVISPDKKRMREDIVQPSDKATVVPGSLHVKGVVRAQAFMQFSDIRLKTNIEDIVDALHIITQLQGKSYQWKGSVDQNGRGGRRVIGLIAQEVQRVLPEVVRMDPETGLLSVSYAEILPVLIEAFKEFLSNYQDNQRDIHNELRQLRTQVESFSKQLKEAQATEQEKQRMIVALTRTSRILLKRPNGSNTMAMFGESHQPHNRPSPPVPYYPQNQLDQYHQHFTPNLAQGTKHTQPLSLPVSNYITPVPSLGTPSKIEAGMDLSSKKTAMVWSEGQIGVLLKGILFAVFIGSLVCSILGVFYLINEGNTSQQISSSTAPTTVQPTTYDDDEKSVTLGSSISSTLTATPMSKTANISMKGMTLLIIGIAGIISSCVGFICILTHRSKKNS